MKINNNIQEQFHGYCKTPLLWKDELLGLTQFQLGPTLQTRFNKSISTNLRLGHLVEHFVEEELKQHDSIKIIAQNVQINTEKQTLGEFDFILQHDKDVFHVEVAYKFYLYDSSIGDREIDNWIGPNRKDSLLLKLQKIKEKQFPLIDKNESILEFEKLGLNANSVKQQVHFKGQLFLPFLLQVDIEVLNPKCIVGYYLTPNQTDHLSECKMFVPSKHDWLVTPHTNVNWQSFADAMRSINESLRSERSVLTWVKTPKGIVEKVFLVWWE